MSTAVTAKRLSLLLHAGGLIFIYSVYGVLQEKIMKSSTYGPNNEHFTSSSLLIVANRIFSVSVGVGILYYKSRRAPEHGTFRSRLQPASSYAAYASVAAFNFLSTTSQYEALKYVSYTTQSLAKTSKMIPVLVVGALVWKKQHRTREWAAGVVILVGCATYLFSKPPSPKLAAANSEDSASFTNGLIGTAFLIGYLFFDGLVSTTQEKVFGRNPASSDPFGPESPVLDQMIWTNMFAGVIALLVALLSSATGSLLPNLRLLFTSPALFWDICIFSGASAFGLIILLNTIASFGALTSSLVMTVRQFLSILINAGIFGNFGAVSIEGWCGVGWVASGIWIKINKSFDPPKDATLPVKISSKEVLETEVDELLVKEGFGPELSVGPKRSKGAGHVHTVALQYLLPVAVPVCIAIIVAPFALSSGALQSNDVITKSHSSSTGGGNRTSTWFDSWGGGKGSALDGDQEKSPVDVLATIEAQLDAEEEAELQAAEESQPTSTAISEVDDISAIEEVEIAGELQTKEEAAKETKEEDLLSEADAVEAAELAHEVQGGRWAHELHDAVAPKCGEINTISYKTNLRTGFISYPRSGNSFMRSLVERATGFRTSSVYCDGALRATFVGECDHKNNFFVKTHYPALMKGEEDYYRQFDQAFFLVRNPLDAISSWWHLKNAPRTPDGFFSHEAKVQLPGGKFGEEHTEMLIDLAHRWALHSVYWLEAPILTHTMRYEDLRAAPIPHMMGLLTFLLPDRDLPSLNDLSCMVELDESHEAYRSRKASDFSSWDSYSPEVRTEILHIVRRPFCAFGYFAVLERSKGKLSELDGFCDNLDFEDPTRPNGPKPRAGHVKKRLRS